MCQIYTFKPQNHHCNCSFVYHYFNFLSLAYCLIKSLSLSLSLSLYEDNNKQRMKNDYLNKIWVMLTGAFRTMINNLF